MKKKPLIMTFKKSILILIAFFALSQVYGQHTHENEDDHGHEHEHNAPDHHRHEIGVANSLVYFTNEKEYSYGLHLHYIYNIKNTRLGVGIGYEHIFDDHGHNSIGLAVIYNPFRNFYVNLSPGIAFEGADFDHLSPALHLETSYEFQLHELHIGPSLEVAMDKEDIHISFGVHLGIGF